MSRWVTRTIGEACELINGGTPKTGVAGFWGGQHQWVTPAEMGKRSTPYIDATERALTDAGLANCSASPVPSHSVILSSRAPIGHLVINTVPMSFNQGCKGLIPRPGLDHKFLYYFLLANVELLNALGTGATFKELSGGKLKEVALPIPPLAEQKRIVAILDEAFEGIAKATANAERNLANAREAAATLLDKLLRQSGGTRVLTLEQAVADNCSLSYGIVQPGNELTDGLPIVRPTDIGDRTVGLSGLKRIATELAAGYQRTTLMGNDLLLCVRGTTGVVSQALPELAGANVTRGIVPIRFNPSILNQSLGYFVLLSDSVQRQIRKATYGAALMQINIRDLRKITISVPSIDRQSQLLEDLEDVYSKSAHLGVDRPPMARPGVVLVHRDLQF